MGQFEQIWQYSRYYGEMLYAAQHLYEIGEGYAAFSILLNAMEHIIKALREDDSDKLVNDIRWLKEIGAISEEDAFFLNGSKESGIRKIRNLMTHKDLYQYCVDVEGTAYPFADKETWIFLYEMLSPRIIAILCKAITFFN